MRISIQILISLIILVPLTVSSLFADVGPSSSIDELHSASCPESWVGIKYTIDKPGTATLPPWTNAGDKSEFVDYLRLFSIDTTIPSTTLDKLSDDELTAASECIKRRNAIVDRYFDLDVGGDIAYTLRMQILLPILAQYAQLSRQAIELEGIRNAEEAAELERKRLGRLITTINQHYLLILQTQ